MSATPMPVVVLEWKALERNSLRGFASISIGKLSIKDVAVHCSNGKRWASLPAKPIIDSSGAAKKGDNGKTVYAPILEWTDRDASDRFSAGVIEALEAKHPGSTGI